ncbi:polyprenyl synthetase family protein [Streptomyces sp. NBC_00237]|uniref:polyprenyl synthetase family protein n=1 Tax=Streptomyces sp. NBC_00237 TaxID=2975687 RepID=UPI0022582E55|nr:polyprenyl synthetase family protein [Streptomyces sp. NBC_00237]MCX5205728.1 polyprenyl synthetase family protein [Streptomyces sp. NBC_00237]
MRTQADVSELDLNSIRAQVNTRLTRFFQEKAADEHNPHLPIMANAVRDFVAGGKLVRPLFATVGWHATGGTGDVRQITRIAAGIELLHASLLIHDDVMDESATRRGKATVHHTLPRFYGAPATRNKALRFGVNAAINTGDLTAMWADQLVTTAGLTHAQQSKVLPLWHSMREEVLTGQFLDLRHTGRPSHDLDVAYAIVHLKTSLYTITRPLQIGASLNHAEPETLDACAAYGNPLGEAFQLRDDVLGVFGDTKETGKPVGDDLIDGKHTVLAALALRHASPAGRHELQQLLADPGLDQHGVTTARRIIESCGALEMVEARITNRYRQALRALETAPFSAPSKEALARLAQSCTVRDR